MEYILKPHARQRLQERLIPESMIRKALEHPTKMEYDNKGRLLVKRLYKKNGRERLLLIAGEVIGNTLEIITVIDTSKVRKHL